MLLLLYSICIYYYYIVYYYYYIVYMYIYLCDEFSVTTEMDQSEITLCTIIVTH